MDDTQKTQKNKKQNSQAGLIGFFLGLGGILSCGLSALPGLILCIIGIIKGKYKILSYLGLLICIFWLFFLLSWTPPGTTPYPISIAKYCFNGPSFWVRYRTLDLRKAQSQYWFFGGSGGTLYFKTEKPEIFEEDDIISFAKKNNWRFKEKFELYEKDISRVSTPNGELVFPEMPSDPSGNYELEIKQYESDQQTLDHLNSLQISLFERWIKGDCIVLSFETDNQLNLLSHVVISNDNTEMAVYYNGSR